jgi:hypothetical protein
MVSITPSSLQFAHFSSPRKLPKEINPILHLTRRIHTAIPYRVNRIQRGKWAQLLGGTFPDEQKSICGCYIKGTITRGKRHYQKDIN